MQWKTLLFAPLLLPINIWAQKDADNISTKQIALLDEEFVPEGVLINSQTKLLRDTSLVVAPKTVAPRIKMQDKAGLKSSQYKPVPLIGELAYYGHMNSYMVNYCSSYINNYGSRLAFVRNKGKVFNTIESILAKYDIPKELEYLAVIESALNAHARSPVGAVGYWQFMEPTAVAHGLVVNGTRDDRTNLYRSTHAAAKYLRSLYREFDDWLLVVGAYNCGEGRMRSAISRANGKKDFWKVKAYLPKETQNHVLAFIATATIMERLDQYIDRGLPSDFDWTSLNVGAESSAGVATQPVFEQPLLKRFTEDEVRLMAIVRINEPVDLLILANVIKANPQQLGRWNYDYYEYMASYKKGQTYNLRIPKERLDDYLANKNLIESASRKNKRN